MGSSHLPRSLSRSANVEKTLGGQGSLGLEVNTPWRPVGFPGLLSAVPFGHRPRAERQFAVHEWCRGEE
jgi:hypothetical protein